MKVLFLKNLISIVLFILLSSSGFFLWGQGITSPSSGSDLESSTDSGDTLRYENLGEFGTNYQSLTNGGLSENLFPPPVITNYSHEDIEASLKGLGGDDTNQIGSEIWEKLPEPPPMIKKPIEGWGDLKLGLTYDEVVSVLSNEYPWMVLRPQEDSVDGDQIYFFESFKNDFFTRVQFQFNQDRRLYLLRLVMNPRYFSFLKVYSRLFELYGPPQSNSYVRVEWSDTTRFLELYRNLTVIYIDKKNWTETLPKSLIEDQRQKLLNSVFDNL